MDMEIIKTKDELLLTPKAPSPAQKDHVYYGHGKLLLTGEYGVLEGARALAIPTRFGQSLRVTYKSSYDPKLEWKSYDVHGNLWFEDTYELWRFKSQKEEQDETSRVLQEILRQVRKQNCHFLRDEVDVQVETRIGFPLEWGLGSSSTLLYNIAQWAYISPFELAGQTMGGSGYDIACAQSDRPIIYSRNSVGPKWSPIDYKPFYSEQLYFVYLKEKKDSRSAIKSVEQYRPFGTPFIKELSRCTQDFCEARDLEELEKVIERHENVISTTLDMPPAKLLHFPDYWGAVKSLGAWGGDFVLVTSDRTTEETLEYFKSRGYPIVMPFSDMILEGPWGQESNAPVQ